MKQNITYRELTKADFPAFKRLINDAWQTERYIHNPAVLDAALDAYMRQCLFSATFACVAAACGEDAAGEGAAVSDGEDSPVLGIIAGSAKGQKPLFSRFFLARCLLRDALIVLRAPKADRLAVFSYMEEFSHDRQLIRGKKGRYDAQITFFAVHSVSRGLGTGKALLGRMTDYFRESRVKRCFLFTDTWCNYAFYDRQGFTQAASLTLPPDPGQCTENQMFLYEKAF